MALFGLDLSSFPTSRMTPEALHNFGTLRSFAGLDPSQMGGPMFQNPLSSLLDPAKEKFQALVGTDVSPEKLAKVLDGTDLSTATDKVAKHIKALGQMASGGSGGSSGSGDSGTPSTVTLGDGSTVTADQLKELLTEQRKNLFQYASKFQGFLDHTDIISNVKQPAPGETIKLTEQVSAANPTGDTGVPVPTSATRGAVAESANRLHMTIMRDAGCEPPAGKVVGCQNNACVAGSVTNGHGSEHIQATQQALTAIPAGEPGNLEDAAKLHDKLKEQNATLQASTQGMQDTVEQENSCYIRSSNDLQAAMEAIAEDGCAAALHDAILNPQVAHAIAAGPPAQEPPKGNAVNCDELDLNQQISRHFKLRDLLVTQVKAKNCPANEGVITNLKALATNALDKIKDQFPGMVINSAYRSPQVNAAVGGASNSQHSRGQAADIEVPGMSNAALAQWVKANISYDQLILEYHNAGQPSSGWVHVSYNSGGGRKMAFRIGGSGSVPGFA